MCKDDLLLLKFYSQNIATLGLTALKVVLYSWELGLQHNNMHQSMKSECYPSSRAGQKDRQEQTVKDS